MNHGWMNVSTCLHLLSFHASGRRDGFTSSSSSSSRGGELLLAVTLPQPSLLVSAHAYYLHITCACILPTRDGFSNSLTCKFIFLSLSFTSRRGGGLLQLNTCWSLHNEQCRYILPSFTSSKSTSSATSRWVESEGSSNSVCWCVHLHISLHLLGWNLHYDELDPTGKCPGECQKSTCW